MSRSLGIPVKLLHEAAGHVVTAELKTGEVYRGTMVECEDNWNCQLENITFTAKDGKVSQLEHVFIRGSRVRFMIIPDMLKNAPMFKRLEARIRGKGAAVGVGRGRAVAMRARATAGRGGGPIGRGSAPPVRRNRPSLTPTAPHQAPTGFGRSAAANHRRRRTAGSIEEQQAGSQSCLRRRRIDWSGLLIQTQIRVVFFRRNDEEGFWTSMPNAKSAPGTRQWAAWTRQEEENFFNALRQVGKNFEKITHRVQSKNKDQVRHYYYRLVRRMKKLLGPEFSLDAKDSKDTIAAMLRWWSLLEKFSCSASKLHLKPRRFKSFVEALGNQLLKDRNKSRRKCPRVDMCLSSQSPGLSKAPGNDPLPLKFLSEDAQNSSKVSSPKGTFLKRSTETTSSKSGATKGDLSATRTVKQKRRAGGVVASAAYKKWEKAAMAGVSLVADAAEELERSTVDPSLLSNVDGRTFTSSSNNLCTVDGISINPVKESDPQAPAKLKLQLFPIDEATRKALEKDEHNPHLELTLSSRKKISSVLEHLNRKWGNSNIASGELMMFPYCAHQEDLPTYQRWTTRDTVAVADVFDSVNSPSVFRLRYGWFSLVELEVGVSEISLTQFENSMIPEDIQVKSTSGEKACMQKDSALLSSCTTEQYPCNSKDQSAMLPAGPSKTSKNDEVPEQPVDAPPSQFGRQKQVEVPATHTFEDDQGMNSAAISEGEWADTLTDISVGYLLTEASKGANSDCIGTSVVKSAMFLENPCSYDSFDAAVALHASCYQSAEQPAHTSHSTIWGGDETCDEFSFHLSATRMKEGSNTDVSSSPDCDNEVHPLNSEGFRGFLQDLAGAEAADNPYTDNAKDTAELCAKSPTRSGDQNELKDQSLADIYWPDSLGPLDLEIPSVRYQADDLLLGDSQNSWSRMMANSLDAFRNLSFFSMDKNDSIPPIM